MNDKQKESDAIHQHLLEIAPTISDALSKAISTNGPLTLPPAPHVPFAAQLCRTVAGQQLSTKAAQSIWNRVLESAGNAPLLDYVAAAQPDTLRRCGLSDAKVKTIIGVAQAAQRGQLDAADLSQMDSTQRAKQLTALWGIGQWTADMMGIFYFADADIWPDGDVTARNTLEKLTSKRRKREKTAAHFAPYRSYLALHMWRYVDTASSTLA